MWVNPIATKLELFIERFKTFARSFKIISQFTMATLFYWVKPFFLPNLQTLWHIFPYIAIYANHCITLTFLEFLHD